MLKVGTIVLVIALVFAGLYSILVVAAPKIIAGSTLEAATGKSLADLADAGFAHTLVKQTRHLGVFAVTTTIAMFFVLFGPFRRAERWAWWLFLILALIVWGYGLAVEIGEGDRLNTILHLIGAVLMFLGLLLPVKEFFGKKA